jgi:protein-L-isoaspartate(D-aspartate) O-methyltransferase
MRQNVSFIAPLHASTKRDYVGRVLGADKAECATVAKKWGSDYWDGARKFGYGGYEYDGRWGLVAQRMIDHYGLDQNSRILDVGCGKGFLLYELKKILPGAYVRGIDISTYAIKNSKEEIRKFVRVGRAENLDFDDSTFDLVLTITTLHNLYIYDLVKAMQEIQRVSREKSYVAVESYRNEREKVNLMYWQLTCEAFFTPAEWSWVFNECGYAGDYEFIFFE